jgi:stress-induced morphogen
MPMSAGDIEKMIKDAIPDARVTIRDLAGDGDHYAAEVVSESFRGKNRVQQHQMVYNALQGNMGGGAPRAGAADERSRIAPLDSASLSHYLSGNSR